MKIKVNLLMDVSFDLYESDDREYFEKEIMASEALFLHSNEIGDTVGKIESVEIDFNPKALGLKTAEEILRQSILKVKQELK